MNLEKPFLVMFVGGPGSGKTTFARLLAKELKAVVLNSDAARMSMWGSKHEIKAAHANPTERTYGNQLTFGALDYTASQILEASYNVVYDANANKLGEREKLAAIATSHEATPIVVWLKTPTDVALSRITERQDTHDQMRHDEDKAREIVETFRLSIEEPGDNENVVEISGERPFEEQYHTFAVYLDSLA